MAPAYAVPRLLARNGLSLQDFDFYEIHEAFAATVLTTLKAWEDPDFCKDAPRSRRARSGPSTGPSSTSTAPRSPPATPSRQRAGASSPRSPSSSRRPAEARGLISICAAGGQGVVAILEALSMSDLFTSIVSSPVGQAAVGVPQTDPAAPLRARPAAVRGARPRRRWWSVRRRRRVLARRRRSRPRWRPRPTPRTRSVPSCSTSAAAVDPAELDQLRLLGAPAVKALRRNGRVVVIGTDPTTLTGVTEVTTQRALEGAVRSLGKELRAGRHGEPRSRTRRRTRRSPFGGRVLPLRPVGLRRRSGGPGRRVDER